MKRGAGHFYHSQTRRKNLVLAGLLAANLLLLAWAMNAGAANTSFGQVWQALLGKESGIPLIVVWNIRLPRVLAAIITGAGLAVSGCVMQTCLKNPLASPSALGISNAAAFGANLAIVAFGAGTIRSSSADAVTILNPYSVSFSAFAFSMLATLVILFLTSRSGFSSEAVVLAGVAFGSLFSAASTLVQYFAQDVQVAAMVFWTFGDLGRISWRELGILALAVAVGLVFFLWHRWDYNALDSGEDTARGLGVNVGHIRFITMLLASLITAISVSYMGIIGFVGLIAPQMMRRTIGTDHRFLLPASLLCGAALLLLSDTLARTMLSPVVLPVGAITSFFGAPLFLFLLVRRYKRK